MCCRLLSSSIHKKGEWSCKFILVLESPGLSFFYLESLRDASSTNFCQQACSHRAHQSVCHRLLATAVGGTKYRREERIPESFFSETVSSLIQMIKYSLSKCLNDIRGVLRTWPLKVSSKKG